MEELTPLDKHLINSAMEAVLVLGCLNSDNLYKAECLLCQIWQTFKPSKRPGICKQFKRLVEKDLLPLEPDSEDSDGSWLYRISYQSFRPIGGSTGHRNFNL
jgi:hypothetical protein